MKRMLLINLILMITLWQGLAQPGGKMKGSSWCSQKKISSKTIPELKDAPQSGPVHAFDVLKYNLNLDLTSCYSSRFGTPPEISQSEIMTKSVFKSS